MTSGMDGASPKIQHWKVGIHVCLTHACVKLPVSGTIWHVHACIY